MTAVHEVLDEVQSPAVDVRRVLTAVGAGDLRQARARQVGDGAWTPEILLIGTDITDADTARLQQLLTSLPRVSIAAVRET